MKRFGLMFLCLALAATMAACAANPPATTPTPTPRVNMTGPAPGMTGGVSPAPTDDTMTTGAMTGPQSTALSKKANEAAAKISEIDSCVTAIIGDTCVAGVTFDPQYKGVLTDRIRDMVASRIQSVAPEVARVAVTNDPEIAAQINGVAEKISKASALRDLTGELDVLIGKIE